jgi:hypothetical protein
MSRELLQRRLDGVTITSASVTAKDGAFELAIESSQPG